MLKEAQHFCCKKRTFEKKEKGTVAVERTVRLWIYFCLLDSYLNDSANGRGINATTAANVARIQKALIKNGSVAAN
jgi:hypothetical protein